MIMIDDLEIVLSNCDPIVTPDPLYPDVPPLHRKPQKHAAPSLK